MDDYRTISNCLTRLRPRDWLEQAEGQIKHYEAYKANKLIN